MSECKRCNGTGRTKSLSGEIDCPACDWAGVPIDDEDDFEDEDEGEFYSGCMLMADGQCLKAGSEECDWMCGALDSPGANHE